MSDGMKRVVLYGTGSAMKDFLSVAEGRVEIVGLADSDRTRQGTLIEGHRVQGVEAMLTLKFDYVVITARQVDAIRDALTSSGIHEDRIIAFYPSFSDRLNGVVNRDIELLNKQIGLSLPPVGLATMYLGPVGNGEEGMPGPEDFVRNQSFRLAARQISNLEVEGAVAELGVYQGDQARLLNAIFPHRTLYLFDTFEGFSAKDLGAETGSGYSAAALGDFANTSVDLVMRKMPNPDRVRIRQGFFPGTAEDLEDRFAFVSLDVDLHDPTLAGLEWFYERLNPGGFIFVHDYNNVRYLGVRHAVDAFVRARQACCVPIPDFAGSVVITR